MGRPKVHGERTQQALLGAAERLAQRYGVAGLSVRRLADEVGTSTRAVYSLYGSKEGLIDALGGRAFDLLAEALARLEPTGDPRLDLVRAGAVGFRGLVVDHPALFRVGVRQPKAGAQAPLTRQAGATALRELRARMARIEKAGLLRHRTVDKAVWEFHAMCEGLAELELRDPLPSARSKKAWRDALTTLVSGLTTP